MNRLTEVGGLRALAATMTGGDERDALLRAADGYDEMAKRAAQAQTKDRRCDST